ncbi:MAG: Rmf/CrpP family protein [Methylobacterium sp.]|jgi:ribosome modulation factor|uniref:ribosome modulation factor n=1 Tax=unclassified Methylobacterium TaxID=2615210 RepID=UPI000AFD8C3D|nr:MULTISPECIES: Rmf/CrpP family protein [unclassified Methylobacterium]MDO9425715.1 Rmf/CrpP family protein [Methylobacterium sp.]
MPPDPDATATASDSPFIQGRNARTHGKPAETCPYPEGSADRQAWLQAWEEAGPPADAP